MPDIFKQQQQKINKTAYIYVLNNNNLLAILGCWGQCNKSSQIHRLVPVKVCETFLPKQKYESKGCVKKAQSDI